jgi:hypothetical protein
MNLMQMVVQGRWLSQSSLTILPHVDDDVAATLASPASCKPPVSALAQLFSPVNRSKKGLDRLRMACRGTLSGRDMDDIARVVARLPEVQVTMTLGGPTTMVVDMECSLKVDLARLNPVNGGGGGGGGKGGGGKGGGGGGKKCLAYAPVFPKPKDEGYWLVLAADDELYALKRVSLAGTSFSRRPGGGDTKGNGAGSRGGGGLPRTSTQLMFSAPEEPGSYTLTLFLMSDSYLGLDQQYTMQINVTEA